MSGGIEVTLGGVPIRLQAGAVQCSYAPLGGVATRRRSGGDLVKMRNWRKTAITITGTGWVGAGFSGLDFDEPLTLNCNQPLTLRTVALTGTIPGTIRSDDAPWAMAYVGGEYVNTAIAMVANAFTITAVASATDYLVRWMPSYQVMCEPPAEAMDSGSATYDWTIEAEEV